MQKLKLESKTEEIGRLLKGGYNLTQIANILGEYQQAVMNLVKAKFPEYECHPHRGNLHYFDNIDSYAKAYILGFIAADGALIKTNTTVTLTITIKYEDKAVLEFIKSEIGNTHKLQEIRRTSPFGKEIHHIRYTLSSPILAESIMKYGIGFNKSLTMGNILENIPVQYRDAFIIGYFDGDGSVSIDDRLKQNQNGYLTADYSLYISFRGTTEFLKGVCKHLNISESHIKSYDSIPRLTFANKKDVVRLFKCYDNLPFFYERKYNKFLQRINLPCYDKYKVV